MGLKTVLFDFDGTIFDTVEGITKSIQYALRKHGREEPLERLRCFAGPPLVDKFMEVYGVDQAEAEALVTDFRERYVPVGVYESRPFPGIRSLLEGLAAAGLTLGIATSKPQNMAELLLERSGLKDCFSVIVGSRPGLNNEKKWQIVEQALGETGTPLRVVTRHQIRRGGRRPVRHSLRGSGLGLRGARGAGGRRGRGCGPGHPGAGKAAEKPRLTPASRGPWGETQ